jgi:hypothetical protein
LRDFRREGGARGGGQTRLICFPTDTAKPSDFVLLQMK